LKKGQRWSEAHQAPKVAVRPKQRAIASSRLRAGKPRSSFRCGAECERPGGRAALSTTEPPIVNRETAILLERDKPLILTDEQINPRRA
jgi:hypothetical protein